MSNPEPSPNPNLNDISADDPATSPIKDARQSVIQDNARRTASMPVEDVGIKRRPRPSTGLSSYAAGRLASSKSQPVDRHVASSGPDEVDWLPPKHWGDPPPYTPRPIAYEKGGHTGPLVESSDSGKVEHALSNFNKHILRFASRDSIFPIWPAPVINSSLMESDLLKPPSRPHGLVPRSHEKNIPSPNLYTGAAGTPVAGSSYSDESSEDRHTISISSDKKSASLPTFPATVPDVQAKLTFLCSELLSRLTQIRGFDFYFSFLDSLEEKVETSDLVNQVRCIFFLGIPLCYIFDLLPAEEGFTKINMSRFNTEEFAANPRQEMKRALSSFIMRLSSTQVKQTIPGCVPFLRREIWGPPDELIKVINTVNSIIEYLPPDVFLVPSRTSTPNPPHSETGYIYGLTRPTNPLVTIVQHQTADAALNHARMTEHLISDALAGSGLEGLYYIQVGFNKELITRGQGTLEEIYIYTDSEFQNNQESAISQMLARLSQILSPFPGVLYTPNNTYHISPYLDTEELDESELWFSSKMHGVFQEGLGLFKPIVRGGGSQSGVSASGDSASHSKGQGNRASDKEKGKGYGISEGNNEEDGFEDEQANSGGGGSGEGSSSRPIDSRRDHEPKILSIPFHAKLVIKGEKQEVLSQFTTSATVNMKLTENTLGERMKGPSLDSNSHPDGWFGPWFSIQIPFIQTDSSDAFSDNARYNMNMAQVRVVASSGLSSFLSFSPLNSHNVEDPVKAKSERNCTGGGWATLSGAPSLKIGGSTSQITGQETSQKKWGIVASPSSDTKTKKSIIWKYTLNDRYYDPQPTATFQPGPTVNFGHKLYARRPYIEVELVVHWSVTPDSTRSRLRRLFSGYRSKESPQPPNAFTNLLHQVSMSVDLESLDANAWVVGLNPDLPDEESLLNFQGSRQFEPIRVNADSERSTLKYEVTLQRALHGCIQLVKK